MKANIVGQRTRSDVVPQSDYTWDIPHLEEQWKEEIFFRTVELLRHASGKSEKMGSSFL